MPSHSTFHFLIGENFINFTSLPDLTSFYQRMSTSKSGLFIYHKENESLNEHIHAFLTIDSKYSHQKIQKVPHYYLILKLIWFLDASSHLYKSPSVRPSLARFL